VPDPQFDPVAALQALRSGTGPFDPVRALAELRRSRVASAVLSPQDFSGAEQSAIAAAPPSTDVSRLPTVSEQRAQDVARRARGTPYRTSISPTYAPTDTFYGAPEATQAAIAGPPTPGVRPIPSPNTVMSDEAAAALDQKRSLTGIVGHAIRSNPVVRGSVGAVKDIYHAVAPLIAPSEDEAQSIRDAAAQGEAQRAEYDRANPPETIDLPLVGKVQPRALTEAATRYGLPFAAGAGVGRLLAGAGVAALPELGLSAAKLGPSALGAIGRIALGMHEAGSGFAGVAAMQAASEGRLPTLPEVGSAYKGGAPWGLLAAPGIIGSALGASRAARLAALAERPVPEAPPPSVSESVAAPAPTAEAAPPVAEVPPVPEVVDIREAMRAFDKRPTPENRQALAAAVAAQNAAVAARATVTPAAPVAEVAPAAPGPMTELSLDDVQNALINGTKAEQAQAVVELRRRASGAVPAPAPSPAPEPTLPAPSAPETGIRTPVVPPTAPEAPAAPEATPGVSDRYLHIRAEDAVARADLPDATIAYTELAKRGDPEAQTWVASDHSGEYALKKAAMERQSAEAVANDETPPAPVTMPSGVSLYPPGWMGNVPTALLRTDPRRFQYKATGESGVTGELRGTSKWNPDAAPVSLVWQDPADGQVYVVNGHNRYELATRVGQPTMPVYFLDAATPEEARSQGAIVNISEGRGTAVDAAKVFREAGATPETLEQQHGVSLRGDIARSGIALSRLTPDLFDQVATGKVPTNWGVAIGDELQDSPDLQRVALKAVKDAGGRYSENEVREVAKQVLAVGTETGTQETLFGAEKVDQSLYVPRAQLVTALQKRLGADRRLFGYVSQEGRAQELARAGTTQIDVGAAQGLADQSRTLSEVFDRLYTRSGPIAGLVNEGARRIARGEKPGVVAADIYGNVGDAVASELQSGGVGPAPQSGGVAVHLPGGGELTQDGSPRAGSVPPAPAAEPAPAPEAVAPAGPTAPAEPSLFGTEEPHPDLATELQRTVALAQKALPFEHGTDLTARVASLRQAVDGFRQRGVPADNPDLVALSQLADEAERHAPVGPGPEESAPPETPPPVPPGEIHPAVLGALGGGVAGGAVGAVAGAKSDTEHPVRGALIGGALGALGGGLLGASAITPRAAVAEGATPPVTELPPEASPEAIAAVNTTAKPAEGGQINLSRYTLDPDGVTLMREATARAAARYGLSPKSVISNVQERELARQIYRGDTGKMLANPMRWGAAELIGARDALAEMVGRKGEIATKLLSGTTPATEKTILDTEYGAIDHQMQGVLGRYLGDMREAARAVSSGQAMAEAATDPAYWMLQAARKLRGNVTERATIIPEDIQEKLLEKLKAGGPEAAADYVSKLSSGTLGSFLRKTFVVDVISSPAIYGKAIVSGLTHNDLRMVENAVATMGDAVWSGAMGAERTRSAFNMDMLAAAKRGRVQGAKNALAVFRNRDINDPYAAIVRKAMMRSGHEPVVYDSPFLSALDAVCARAFGEAKPGQPRVKPSRMVSEYDVGVNDRLLRTHAAYFALTSRIGVELSIAEESRVMALREGLKPNTPAFTARVAQLRATPTNEMFARAVEAGKEASFTNSGVLAEVGSAMRRVAIKRGPWTGAAATALMPVVRIAGNVAEQTLQRTPLGFLGAFVSASQLAARMLRKLPVAELEPVQRQLLTRLSRASVGSVGMVGLGYELAKWGYLTGVGPDKPSDRQVLLGQGWEPSSIRFSKTGTWNQIGAISPVGTALTIGATLYEMAHAGMPGTPLEQRLEQGAAMAKVIAQNPLFTGPQSFSAALASPTQAGARAGEQVAIGAIPLSGLLRRLSQSLDPTVRQPQGMSEAIQAIVPGASQYVPAQTDWRGNEVKRASGFTGANPADLMRAGYPAAAAIGATVGPAAVHLLYFGNPRLSKDDPDAAELIRTGVGVPRVAQRKDEPEEDFIARRKSVGFATGVMVHRTIADPDYQQIPAEVATEWSTDHDLRAKYPDMATAAKEIQGNVLRDVIRRARAMFPMYPAQP
jgi:hypothetical protein